MEFSAEELEEILNIFQEESEEQIQKLNENLLKLESNPEDEKVINEIFREAHSLKGAARMIGLNDIQSIAHKLEDIFGLAKKGELVIRPEIIDILCNSVDAIATIIEETVKIKGLSSIDATAIVNQLLVIEQTSLYDLQETPEEQIDEADNDYIEENLLNTSLDKNIMLNMPEFGIHETENPPISSNKEEFIIDESFSSEELKELKQIFYAESLQNIDIIINDVDTLQHFPYDREILSEVYRNIHSIQGAATIINFAEIKDLTHYVKDVFEKAVKEEIFINSEILEVLGKQLLQIRAIIENRYRQEGYDNKLDLKQLESDINKKIETYKVVEKKPKKIVKSKISINKDILGTNEDEILKDLGFSITDNPSETSSINDNIPKQINVDPLSLSDDELGDLNLASIKGVIPLQNHVGELLPEELIDNKTSLNNQKSSKDSFKSMGNTQNELFNHLISDLKVLSSNVDNNFMISTIITEIHSVKSILNKDHRTDLVEIIAKIECILEEAKDKIINLSSEMAEVLCQSVESVSVLYSHIHSGSDEIWEDPGLVYQRLIILYQTARLSSGKSFETGNNVDIFNFHHPKKSSTKVNFIDAIPEKEVTKKENIPAKKATHKMPEFPVSERETASELFKSRSTISPIGEISQGHDKASSDNLETYTIKTLRVDTRKLDQLVAQVGELIIAKIKAKERLTDIEKLINLIEEWQRDLSKTKYSVKNIDKKPLKSSFMPEGTSIYTPGKDIHTVIRENSDTLAQLTNHINLLYHNIQEDDTRLSLIINELEERIKNVRLLPLTTIFNMFPRMVRDISREQNKDIDIEIYGSETTVDKKIIEEIKSPLMHIIRNSIDHGIEYPDEREQKNKSRTGKIILSARHLESSVLIEVVDDGRGIDIEAIKSKVLEKELLTSAELAAMNDNQIMNIIFWPGFTTGKNITDISGRGVGMDVVHTKILQLNGKVKVESKLGMGCRVLIQLPVTMATIQVFLVKIHSQTYAIPTSAIKTAVLIEPDDIFYKEGRQTVLVGNTPVFLCNLGDLLELPGNRKEATKKDKLTVLVLQTEESSIGFIVDGLLADQEILHKNLEPPLVRVRNVAGVTTLGSGEVCLILNVGDLIKTAQMTFGMALRSGFKKKEMTVRKKDILVVDDSVTTRILERNILRAAGYNVTVAVNGLDALTKLATQHIDLVVSDVEMPDINGFELVSKIKKDDVLQKIPVVLVTSLASEVDKQKGMKAGADAYITKGGFDQEELLSTIRRLLL